MPILDAETNLFPDNLLEDDFQSEHLEERRWIVFHTKPRQEKAFARDLVNFKIPFFLPLTPKTNLIRGRKVHSYVPIFGGYVFLYVDESQRTKSLSTNRVASTLPVEDQVRLVSDLRNIQQLIATDAPLTVESRLVAGQKVRIKSGPMAGLEGVVEKRRAKSVLYVAVTMLQQCARMEIDDYLLEPI